MAAEKLPVFVVEDQAPILKALVKLLGSFPELELVGSAMSGEAALDQLSASHARVALVDIELPGIDGLELVSKLKAARVDCELVMLTSFVDEEKVFEAMRRGASGYLVKGCPAERLRAAIHTVEAGGTVIEPKLAKAFWAYFKGVQAPRREERLEADEQGLLELVARGLTNAELAGVLGVPQRNLRTRLQKVYAKLGARSHVEAVVVALRRGLIEL